MGKVSNRKKVLVYVISVKEKKTTRPLFRWLIVESLFFGTAFCFKIGALDLMALKTAEMLIHNKKLNEKNMILRK